MTDQTLRLTLTLLAVLALKLLIIARGSVPVALAVLQSAPLSTTIVGSLISAIPLVVFVGTAWPVVYLRRGDPDLHRLLVILALALLIGVYVAPWPVVVVGPLGGGLIRLSRSSRRSAARWQWLRLVAKVFVAAATAYAAWVFLDALWLPHETVRTSSNRMVVGYVLDSGDQWTNILVSGERTVLRLPSAVVTSRRICALASHRDDVLTDEAPSFWRLAGHVLPAISRSSLPRCGG